MSAVTPFVASDQVQTLFTLVPYLLERGAVSVADAAAEFDIDEKRMRALVRKLPFIGLPGEGYYLPHEMFDIDWELLDEEDTILIIQDVALERVPRLSAREAAALLAGLQLAQSIPRVASSEVYAGLVEKLSRGASSAPADVVVTSAPVDDVRSAVSRALETGVAVSFSYRAPDAAETTRTVDPTRVIVTGDQWYLEGWCHLRRAMRTFHLDRVSDLRLTDIAIEHPAVSDGNGANRPGAEPEQTAIVRYRSELSPLLGDYLRHAEVVVAGDVATATIRLADPHTLKRLVARLGGRIEIVSPADARAAAGDWALRALALYA